MIQPAVSSSVVVTTTESSGSRSKSSSDVPGFTRMSTLVRTSPSSMSSSTPVAVTT